VGVDVAEHIARLVDLQDQPPPSIAASFSPYSLKKVLTASSISWSTNKATDRLSPIATFLLVNQCPQAGGEVEVGGIEAAGEGPAKG